MAKKIPVTKKPMDHEENDEGELEDESDNESVYDETEGESKAKEIEDVDGSDDDSDDDDDDDEQHAKLPKKKVYAYHQVPDSTEIKIVVPEKRLTSEYMTIYEYSMIVGTRATHIASGSVIYTDPEGLSDPRDIAKKEINELKCPLSITRKISNDLIEIWEVNEMIKPQF